MAIVDFIIRGLNVVSFSIKKLEEYVVDSSEWALPIISERYRCEECKQAEVKE